MNRQPLSQMNKRNVCRTATVFFGLLAILIHTQSDTGLSPWPLNNLMGASLGLLSAIFATQWVEYQKRQDTVSAQPGTPTWLRRLLFSGVLLLTVLSSNAQTTWTKQYQAPNTIFTDVAYGAGRYVAVGNDGFTQVSTDGITWTTQLANAQSLAGLTGIVYAGGQFVAVGAGGRVLTSADGLTWVIRVSGTLQYLVGITYGGGQYVAVGYAGTILTSADSQTWVTQISGTALDLFRVTYGSGQFVAVGAGGGIKTSPTGVTWTARTSGTIVDLQGVTAGSGNRFVAVGFNSTIVTSADGGVTWTLLPPVAGSPTALYGVAYNPVLGQYVAISLTTNRLFVSLTGTTWTAHPAGTDLLMFGVRHVNGQFIAVGQKGAVRSSPDGVAWKPLTIDEEIEFRGAAYGNGRYVAVGKYPISIAPPIGTVAVTSTDGIHYSRGTTQHFAGANEGFNGVVYGSGQFVAVGGDGIIQTSADGQAWILRYSAFGASLEDIAYGGGQYVAVGSALGTGSYGSFARSTDGLTWTKGPTGPNDGTPNSFAGITYASGQFVIVGTNGHISTSPDGASWTPRPSGSTKFLRSVTYGNGTYVAVGPGGVVLRSVNSTTWATVPAFTGNDFNRITFGNGQFVTVGEDGGIFTSPDGLTWTSRVSNSLGRTLQGLTYANGLFVAVGVEATVVTSPDNGAVPPVDPGAFAITGVTLVSCNAISAAQRQLVFSPQYSGLSGQPISFEVANELVPTTNAGPYTLNIYTDNPSITLKATQSGTAGEASFVYNWLSVCNGGVPPGNQPPVAPVIPNTNGVVGQVYSLLIPPFTDPEGLPLTYSITGLPPGLLVTSGGNIVGPPTMAGVYVITVTATDPGGLSASATYTLTISPAGGNPGAFAITGVTLVSCDAISPTQRQLVFTPQYAGLSGQPVTFEVANEMVPTTNAGPYTLNMYTDNPIITLKATQSGTVGEASYLYSWLLACSVGNARVGAGHSAEHPLRVQVLGNPVENGAVLVEVRGAGGQPVQMTLTDLRSQVVGSHQVGQADGVEQHTFAIGQQPAGLYLLRVNTPTQMRTLKVLKR